MIFRVATLLDLRVHFQQKNHKAYKATGRYGPFKEKKKSQQNCS